LPFVLIIEPPSFREQIDAAYWIGLAQVIGTYLSYASERQSRRIFLQRRTIEEERARSERLLENMLPAAIAERLKRGATTIADGHDSVTVLFADIVGFTTLSGGMQPVDVVIMLNAIFSKFDELARSHGLEKIKTIGDAYMVVGGIPAPLENHAQVVASMALAMRDELRKLDESLAIRIGLHTGPGVPGVIGTSKYSYDLWGDTVNTASRMESHGAAGEIHMSQACRVELGDAFAVEDRGPIEIKGKGPMRTFWLRSPSSASAGPTSP
jgi:adenylate cyclase